MSDDDDFMQDSGDEDYDFDYEGSGDDDEAGDIGIENKYYNAKQMKVDNPEEAVDEFLGIPPMEMDKGDWGFKGLKQAIKLEFKLGRYSDAVEHYRELLTYVKSAVTRNYSEKSINNMLDYIEKGSADSQAYQCMEEFYSLTLESFQNTNNERLWLKTNIKLARLWLERKEYSQLSKKVRELHRACQKEDGTDDTSKGTYLLELFALEIQMYAETKNNKRLKALYQRALRVRSAVPHPKIMGIIRECGGKMHMSEENWEEAQSDFFESFRNYDEAGSIQRIQVLKYLVLTTMLMKSTINPFDSQETKPYKNDPRISVMTDLVDAYQRDDIHVYEAVLSKNPDVLADPFIAENIDEVSRNMRTKAVLKLIAPYTRFSLQFISKHVRIAVPEVLDILGFLILTKQLDAKIDQSNGTVEVSSPSDVERIRALQEWSSSLRTLWQKALNGEGLRADDGTHGAAGAMFTPGFGDESPIGMRSLNPRSRREFRGKAPGVKTTGAP
ncbi:PCI-domain-containing protein [Penicillium verhagenii]|uniref:PCI-domain-containing protein n=1 Tax=Penicillium verhagenii TaxID=1562060 RepID=UPI0025455717|nr:PCI-domain-containing protein [Penicillium verhagenii]KAJ5918239.1 PCI-domain-containing protein [Penicillium verhagenii]KAJ5930432.1 PCI-domain-containing protein [Penicillium verhagenii]